MSGLSIETLTFKEAERDQWMRGNRKMLTMSGASPFLKQVLVEKARVRPNRFFGEAFVASHVSHGCVPSSVEKFWRSLC